VIIDIQFNQGSASWPALRDGVLTAEAAGFSTVWNLDHFSGAMFNSDSMMECFTSLTAWATVTSRIKVGTLVTNINNRHPGLLANIVSSLQDISGGRLMLGVGAGTSPNSPYGAEQRALNMDVLTPMSARHQKLLENITTDRASLIRAALTARGNTPGFDVSVWSPFVPEYADPDHPFHKELVADGVTRLIMFDLGAPHLETIQKTARYLA